MSFDFNAADILNVSCGLEYPCDYQTLVSFRQNILPNKK